jgi:hypothetical protein
MHSVIAPSATGRRATDPMTTICALWPTPSRPPGQADWRLTHSRSPALLDDTSDSLWTDLGYRIRGDSLDRMLPRSGLRLWSTVKVKMLHFKLCQKGVVTPQSTRDAGPLSSAVQDKCQPVRWPCFAPRPLGFRSYDHADGQITQAQTAKEAVGSGRKAKRPTIQIFL